MVNISHCAAYWQPVIDALQKHFHDPDIESAHIVCAAIAAHCLNGVPVWPMVIAPPGSGKTELVGSFEGLAHVHLIDTLTPKTFISGQIDDPTHKRTTSASLLQRIGANGIIICPDFSTITAIKHDARVQILADMRRIYDGALSKEFGTDNNLRDRTWKGRITFAAAATPDIDRHHGMSQALGERFIITRLPRPNGIQAARRALNQNKNQMKHDLQDAVHRLMNHSEKGVEPTVPARLQDQIAALTEYSVRARTYVHRDRSAKKLIEYIPIPEAPTRMAQQLTQLMKGGAKLAGRCVVDDTDYRLAVRAAFDSIPPARLKILESLRTNNPEHASALPDSTRSYAKEELKILELLTSDFLSELASELLKQAKLL